MTKKKTPTKGTVDHAAQSSPLRHLVRVRAAHRGVATKYLNYLKEGKVVMGDS